ncbi:glycosyltransferase [Maridesulfovibrio zosterae]|uniref:glycosyltransferase n=1 Tax=Maridesulfovibrio zosterae TaxID=82171 RepID=UPI00041EABA8|nr:glycosyltransferase [Maridesulfovibrio zosterae]
MRVGYYLSDLNLTGGTKVINQHLKQLEDLGHEPKLFVKRIATTYPFHVPCTVVADPQDISGQVDVLVVTRLTDLKTCLKPEMPHLVMFYQRMELNDLNSYYAGKMKLPKYSSLAGRLFLKAKFKLQTIGIERFYRSEVTAWTPCHPMAHSLENQYGKIPYFIRNTVDHSLFTTDYEFVNATPTVLSIGDYRLGIKNIPRVFDAVREIKKTTPINFIRISPTKIYPEEEESGVVDEFFVQQNDKEMAGLYNRSDIVVSASTSEGFGMPALEGMASGCVCVLSNIPAHNMFDKICEEKVGAYALYFDPQSTADLVTALHKALDAEVCAELKRNGRTVSQAYSSELQKQDLCKALKKFED